MLIFLGLLHFSSAINCIDFVLHGNTKYESGSKIKTVYTPRGQAQCEEECRKLSICSAYTMQKFNKKQCTLYRQTNNLAGKASAFLFHQVNYLDEVAIGYISGTKSTELDFHGHLFDVNYCREVQKERLCPKGPECTNDCPIGYKQDALGLGD